MYLQELIYSFRNSENISSQKMMTNQLFQHCVASGDPLPDQVVIWTRVTTDTPQQVSVIWKMALDSEFSQIVASGVAIAQAEADYTVKVDVAGLEPTTRYFYKFEALDVTSPIGRTKTLSVEGASHLRFAQVSCAKFNAGFFNAYGCIAARDDLDFLLHLRDYIYEAANNPPGKQTPGANIVCWCDFDSHGYNIIDVTPERVTAQWWAVDTVLRPSHNETCMGAWIVESGTPQLVPAS
jgi:phosphodiesterase/alkaline phosphatase D-like protein